MNFNLLSYKFLAKLWFRYYWKNDNCNDVVCSFGKYSADSGQEYYYRLIILI